MSVASTPDEPAPESAAPRTGRPVVTTHGEIEQAAFRLFAANGFAATTLEAIATETGVGRRTLFRYYRSKNDIPWGQFDSTLVGFRAIFDGLPDDLPVSQAVHRAVVRFNRFSPHAQPPHRERIRLILSTPELQAHSVLQYRHWRAVIAEFVARRYNCSPDDLLPVLIGQVSLALALSAYEIWLDSESLDLEGLLNDAMAKLRDYLA